MHHETEITFRLNLTTLLASCFDNFLYTNFRQQLCLALFSTPESIIQHPKCGSIRREAKVHTYIHARFQITDIQVHFHSSGAFGMHGSFAVITDLHNAPVGGEALVRDIEEGDLVFGVCFAAGAEGPVEGGGVEFAG